jgi:hypothetical protein
VTDAQQQEMAVALWRVTRNARDRIYAAATEYLNSEGVFDVPPLDGYALQALTEVLSRVVSDVSVAGELVTTGNRTHVLWVESARKDVSRAVSRHVQQPARFVVKEVADSVDGFGWARMLTGATSCAFCAMMASRGPIYSSKKAALYRGGSGADRYHDGCDCLAVLVRNPHLWEGQDSHRKLENLWIATGSKNAFRRAWDKKVRDGESPEFIASSMRLPGAA